MEVERTREHSCHGITKVMPRHSGSGEGKGNALDAELARLTPW